jgi:hypothetical protein
MTKLSSSSGRLNWGTYRRKWSRPVSRHYPNNRLEGLKDTVKMILKMASDLTEIQTWYLQNSSHMLYRCVCLLGDSNLLHMEPKTM